MALSFIVVVVKQRRPFTLAQVDHSNAAANCHCGAHLAFVTLLNHR